MARLCQFVTIPIPLRPNHPCICASQRFQPASAALSADISSSLSETLSAIQNSRVIAGLRAKDGLMAMEAARAALKGGISVVIQGLLQENPSSIIGAGTVLNIDDAREAMSAGAKFLTSPCIVMEILDEAQGSGVLYAPGVMTPTEVLCAYEAGAKLVKVYPATILGGGKYISALKRPFPHIPMIASQGISIGSIKQFIDAGTTAVILTDAIFDKGAMEQRDFDSILRLAGLSILKATQAGRMSQLCSS